MLVGHDLPHRLPCACCRRLPGARRCLRSAVLHSVAHPWGLEVRNGVSHRSCLQANLLKINSENAKNGPVTVSCFLHFSQACAVPCHGTHSCRACTPAGWHS